MPATPVYALPYPAASDPADVPVDMQELADRVEAVLSGRFTPIFAQVLTAVALNNGVYQDLAASAGPSITLPSAGDYLIAHGCKMDSGAVATFGAMSYAIGATAAVDADMVEVNSGTGGGRWFGSRVKLKTGLTAVTLTAKYRTSGSVTFSERWIQAFRMA